MRQQPGDWSECCVGCTAEVGAILGIPLLLLFSYHFLPGDLSKFTVLALLIGGQVDAKRKLLAYRLSIVCGPFQLTLLRGSQAFPRDCFLKISRPFTAPFSAFSLLLVGTGVHRL